MQGYKDKEGFVGLICFRFMAAETSHKSENIIARTSKGDLIRYTQYPPSGFLICSFRLRNKENFKMLQAV